MGEKNKIRKFCFKLIFCGLNLNKGNLAYFLKVFFFGLHKRTPPFANSSDDK